MKTIQTILNRNEIFESIKEILQNFDENSTNINFKKGIYIYGTTGCGKTQFIIDLLKHLNYDMIKYDAGDVRNKTLIDSLTSNNISNQNILDMMYSTTTPVRKKVIIMDEIDGMNNGDKGGITSLIKLIRQKKTKKQKSEDITMNPIICIGSCFMDKKIRELMKVCNVFELKKPTDQQIYNLIELYMSDKITPSTKQNMVDYIQGDLRKFFAIQKIYKKSPQFFESNRNNNGTIFERIFKTKTQIEDSKKITKTLIQRPLSIDVHNTFMNETDRTIVALLWHENIIDALERSPISATFPFYNKILDNMCYSDYIDRITFQNQIWQFNEMSSMMKTFYNNKLFHDYFPENGAHFRPNDVRFTKVLTKYSTEYNNQLFIYNMCQTLDLDKKDLIGFFQELRLIYPDLLENQQTSEKIDEILESLNINKLDMRRIYRYLDRSVDKGKSSTATSTISNAGFEDEDEFYTISH